MAKRKTVVDGKTAGPRVRATRERLGLTIAESARRCGIGHQSWADLERGHLGDGREFGVSLDRLFLIAEGLGVDPHELDDRLASKAPSPRV